MSNDSFLTLMENASNTINFDASISKDDIVAIALSDWEIALRAEMKSLEVTWKEKKKKIKEIEDCLARQKDQFERTFRRDDIAKLSAGLSLFGWCPEIEVCVEWPRHKDTATITIAMSGVSNRYDSSFAAYKTTTNIPPQIENLHKELEGLEEESAELAAEIHELRTELHQADSKERAARASLAKQVLGSTPAGTTLLEKLGENS